MLFNEVKLFRGEDYPINQYITLHHPTLKQIFDFGEEEYWNVMSSICVTPSDVKHQLFDSCNLYFDQVDEFDLFCMFAGGFKHERYKIILGNLDFQKLSFGVNTKTNQKVIFDTESDLIIDKMVYMLITDYIRKINCMKKNIETAGNDITRNIMIDDSRRQANSYKKAESKSQLLPIISSLVNCADFKYDYKTVWDMPIYAFFDSMKRIQHMRGIGYTMYGIYSGNVDTSKLNKKELNWFSEL